jgi:hypothetical protein
LIRIAEVPKHTGVKGCHRIDRAEEGEGIGEVLRVNPCGGESWTGCRARETETAIGGRRLGEDGFDEMGGIQEEERGEQSHSRKLGHPCENSAVDFKLVPEG